MDRRAFLGAVGALSLSPFLASCGGSEAPASSAAPKVVLVWARTTLAAIRTTKPGPPMSARSLAIVHTAIYDAWAAYDAEAVGTRLGNGLRRPASERSAANKSRAMSFAAYVALLDQYPTQRAAFDTVMASFGYDVRDVGSTNVDDPARIGVLAGKAVLDGRENDGSNQRGNLGPSGLPFSDYTGYVAMNPPALVGQATPLASIPQPAHWQPLSYVDAPGVIRTPSFLGAHWGRVTPFALASASQFRPPPPKAFDAAGFVEQALEVMDLEANLGDREKTIAEYWADGPSSELPPGHWCLFADWVAERDGYTDDEAARLFFAITNAVFDAGIATWEAKRYYDYARPITAIRFLRNGMPVQGIGNQGPAGGVVSIDGAAWRPFQPDTFVTPPFPEYTSGHSAFSAAAAEVLRLFTGSDAFGARYVQPASSLRIDPAAPRAQVVLEWPTFTEAAMEAGMSRLYGGIHFMDGNREGLALGRKVGALAYRKARDYWEGRA